MNKEFREFLEDELCKVKKLNEGMLIGYGQGVYDTYAYVLKKYDEFHKPVVIPKYVAEYMELAEGKVPLMRILETATKRDEYPKWKKAYDWISANDETFARAWLDGYTVEEEQRYYVINNQNYFLLAKDKGHGFVFSTGGNLKLGNTNSISATFKLTEQEIKDYDERYMAFAIPVENDK